MARVKRAVNAKKHHKRKHHSKKKAAGPAKDTAPNL